MSPIGTPFSWLRGPVGRWAGVLLGCAALGWGNPADAGVVLSGGGRRQGPLTVQADGLRVGEAVVPWQEVLIAVNDAAAERPAGNETVRMRNGEIFIGGVTLLAGKLKLESAALGTVTLDVQAVKVLDFVAGLPFSEQEKAGVLSRARQEDLTGALVWIRGERAAINTVVGAVSLPKNELKRYVFAGDMAPADGPYEIVLKDGCVVRGRVQPTADGLQLTHSILGEKVLHKGDWWSVRRLSDASVVSLADLKPASVRKTPLVRTLPPEPQAERPSIGSVAEYATRLRIWPKSQVVYRLSGEPPQKFAISAVVRLDDVSRGEAKVRVLLAGKAILDGVLTPGGPPLTLSGAAEGGSELSLEVDFGEAVALPCNVVVDDGLIVKQ